MVEHAPGQGGLEGELVLRGPLGVLGLVDAGVFDEVGEGEGAGRDGDVEGRLGRQAQQRAELAREGRCHLLEGEVSVEDGLVRRRPEVGREDHGGAQPLDLAEVPVLEAAEILLPVCQRPYEPVFAGGG